MSFLRAGASQPSPVEVHKLDARPVSAPLHSNARDPASLVLSSRSA